MTREGMMDRLPDRMEHHDDMDDHDDMHDRRDFDDHDSDDN